MAGVYVSYPFCAQKCTYCNFASGVFPRERERRYLEVLRAELSANVWQWRPETVYLGGGTPGNLAAGDLRDLLGIIPGRPWLEATMEAAPGSITAEKARTWAEAGINRVSLGVQSFVETEIRRTGRRHTALTVAGDLDVLRAAGIRNANVDLIAGLSAQTEAGWRESLDWVERVAPEHVSVYMLEVDEDSRLGREMLAGGLRYGAADAPCEDQVADFYEMAVERLERIGIARYEISNFARPGFESRHNLKYWKLEPYVGFGADAHSFDGHRRWRNAESVEEYLLSPAEPRTSESGHPAEKFFVGLRLMEGIRPSAEEWRALRRAHSSFPGGRPAGGFRRRCAPHQPRRAAFQRSVPGVSYAMIDLRSDTVTRPTPEMRRAMMEAEVGDDVYGEDPTVNRLEQRAAEISGKEAALFVPTGTMGNTIAVKLLTEHGQEVICDSRAHVLDYELAMTAWFSGCLVRAIPTENGILTWEAIRSSIRPPGANWAPTGLIEIENTHNMAGGTVYPPAVIREICDCAHELGLKVHMDGARVFNAAAALGVPVHDIVAPVDTVMFCLSKALGAPVGSMLAGRADLIRKGRLYRKRLGGGMRQVGVLAAAGLIALEQTPQRLFDDHCNAKFLAEGLARIPGIAIDARKVVTNIVVFDVSATGIASAEISARLKRQDVLINGINPRQMRAVTHYDVTRAACAQALEALASAVA